MRFKRFCSLGVAAAIGMSILAGTAAAKETTAGLTFDFNQNDGGFTPILGKFSAHNQPAGPVLCHRPSRCRPKPHGKNIFSQKKELLLELHDSF